MKIQLLKPTEFIPGKRYSLLGLSTDIVNSVFKEYKVGKNYLCFENGQTDAIGTKSAEDGFNVVVHEDQEFYILIENNFLIGTFTTRQEAETFLTENEKMIYQLAGADKEDDTVEVLEKKDVEDIALEFFWGQYDSGSGSQFSPTWVEKTANWADYLTVED